MMKKYNKYNLDTIYLTIGRNLKKLYDELPVDRFKDSKLTKIQAFSSEIGYSSSFIYHIFSGKNFSQQPSFITLLTFCNFFNVSMDSLLTETEELKKDTN